MLEVVTCSSHLQLCRHPETGHQQEVSLQVEAGPLPEVADLQQDVGSRPGVGLQPEVGQQNK